MADIFISYTRSDRDWAFWIAEELKALGHAPHIHEWEIRSGDDIMAWMRKRLDAADHVLCVVSDEYLKAEYSQLELNVAMWQAAARKPGFVLFAVVKPSHLPNSVDHLLRCELFGVSEDEARRAFRAYMTNRETRAPIAFPGEKFAVSNIKLGLPMHFLGRDDELAAIEAALAQNAGRVAITTLHGLRGVGKTTLAAAFAERHRRDYRATWWIRAETESTLRADLVDLGVRLKWVGEGETQEQAVDVVMVRLGNEGAGILLIYDNAIDARTLQPYLPPRGATRVIVTSNAAAWGSIAVPVEIEVWPTSVGADYLLARTGRARERAAAEALSQALGGLPLAHEQAAAYCERLKLSLADYRARFEAAPGRVLDDARHAPAAYGRTVAKTFALAIERAASLHPAAAPLIAHAALLAPEPIPLFLFEEARKGFDAPLASALADDGLLEAVATLADFSLVGQDEITITGDAGESRWAAIRLHRLVREVALANLQREVGEKTLVAMAQSVESGLEDARFADARTQVMPHAVSFLYYLQTDQYRDSGAGELYETLAQRVILALFDLGPRNISPAHLAGLLREYYEDGPLFRAISEFRRRNPDAWAAIERPLIEENNFVLRHAMSHALADAYEDDPSLLPGTAARFTAAEKDVKALCEFEFTGYALALIYVREPRRIDRSFVDELTKYRIYPGQQLVGDLLLNLVFQTSDPGLLSWERWLDIRQMATGQRLWEAPWDFIKLHVSELKAAEAFLRQGAAPNGSSEIAQCHANLVEIERKLDAATSATESQPLRELLADYFALGREPSTVQNLREQLAASPNRRDLFWLLLAHPIWYVAEESASILSSLAEEDGECLQMIQDFMADKNWRVQYGANEAAFGSHGHHPEVFYNSVRGFFDNPNCRIRALCTENFATVLMTSGTTRRERLMREFANEIRYWLNDMDCAILEHVYRLFAALAAKRVDLTRDPYAALLGGQVSWLLRDRPDWYALDRSDFLQHIEARKAMPRPLGA